jgi:hypothetical protein
MVDVYNAEPERQAALAEVTKLRRKFDTTTAKGAKAFAKDPEAQAALARLDAAKSAAGMRTSKQDLAALNRIATSDTATMKKDGQGRMTAAPTKAERAVTKDLNAPSKQYFKQVQQAYKNPDVVPTWSTRKQITPEQIAEASNYNVNLNNARYDWVWYENPNTGKGRWALGIIGALENPPKETLDPDKRTYIGGLWRSDSSTVKEINDLWKSSVTQGGAPYIENTSPTGGGNTIDFNELEQALPKLKYSQFQEIIYRLSLERDEDITIEDILDKYDDLYGGGK